MKVGYPTTNHFQTDPLPKIRITLLVPISHGMDAERAMQVLLEIARSHGDVMEDPAPVVVLAEIGENAITFSLRVWTLIRADEAAGLRSDIYLQVFKRFRQEEIKMSLP